MKPLDRLYAYTIYPFNHILNKTSDNNKRFSILHFAQLLIVVRPWIKFDYWSFPGFWPMDFYFTSFLAQNKKATDVLVTVPNENQFTSLTKFLQNVATFWNIWIEPEEVGEFKAVATVPKCEKETEQMSGKWCTWSIKLKNIVLNARFERGYHYLVKTVRPLKIRCTVCCSQWPFSYRWFGRFSFVKYVLICAKIQRNWCFCCAIILLHINNSWNNCINRHFKS